MTIWAERYRAVRVEELIGNEEARLGVIKWLSQWIVGSKPLILVGPPGTGKTSFVHALAAELDYDLVEMNASDTRNKEDLESRILPIFNNLSIFGKKMLLFLDEVDGIAGRQDAGGMEMLIHIMKDPKIPVIMAANVKDTKIKELGKICKLIIFEPIPKRLLMLLLDYILKKENKEMNPQEKILLVRDSYGDVRSLLNSAQSKSVGYNMMRESLFEIDITVAINRYFAASSIEDAKVFLSQADAAYMDPRFGMSSEERRKDIINALFSSIVSSNLGISSLSEVLDVLSKADVIVGRIGRNRHWSLLKYLNNIIAYGIYEQTRGKEIKYSQYGMRWTAMGPILLRSRSIKNLLSDISFKAHVSKSTFGSIYLPYLIQVLADTKGDPHEFAKASNLDEKAGDALAREITHRGKKIWRK